MHTITAGSVLGSATGESERRLREAFAAAAAGDGQGSSGGAPGAGPVVVFLDELDALCPRRSSGRPHEARVVAQLLTLLDGAAGTQPGGARRPEAAPLAAALPAAEGTVSLGFSPFKTLNWYVKTLSLAEALGVAAAAGGPHVAASRLHPASAVVYQVDDSILYQHVILRFQLISACRPCRRSSAGGGGRDQPAQRH